MADLAASRPAFKNQCSTLRLFSLLPADRFMAEKKINI